MSPRTRETVVLAHLSDLHVDGGEHSLRQVRQAVDHLAGLPGQVDAVLITGDIADNADPEEYRQARTALTPLYERFPVLVGPGNHDARAPLRAVFPEGTAAGAGGSRVTGSDADAPVNEVRDLAGVRLLMCDSSVPGRPEGRLAPATLKWLDQALAEAPDIPAFVALHHPPAPLGIPYTDGIGLRNPEDLAQVLRGHPHAAAVLCGHAHTAAATDFAGIPVRCAPGVVSTALLPWERAADGPSWKTLEASPAVAFHQYADGRLTTHIRTARAWT